MRVSALKRLHSGVARVGDTATVSPVEAKELDPALQKTACKYCGSEIALGASLCPECKSYQSRWRNALTYIGGLAGVLALVISALTFTYSKIDEMLAARRWKDNVSVIYMTYPGRNSEHNGEMLITNSGDGDVFISSLQVFS